MAERTASLINEDDLKFIRVAIDFASKSVQESGPPRPRVGAVVARQGNELGRAFRGETGTGDHAEYGLLERKVQHYDEISGATLYTTLEPCTTRNEPKICCAERVISRRLGRVVIGMLDPNQMICGRGVLALRKAGIKVDLFPSEFMAQVEDQNREFIRDQEILTQRVLAKIREVPLPLMNPHILDDLGRLDRSFKIEAVANRETVFIVVGETLVSELLDRHTGAFLRDNIDQRGSGQPFRRGIIVSAKTWRETRYLTQQCPTLSIGSGAPNDLSREWLEEAKLMGVDTFPLASGKGLYLGGPPPRAVLFGQSAEETKAAVAQYVSSPQGLAAFLTHCWV